jgi:hypothetical protein
MLDAPSSTISSVSVLIHRKHRMSHVQSLMMARENNGTEVFIRKVFFLFQPKDMKKIAVTFRNYLPNNRKPGCVDYNGHWKGIHFLLPFCTLTQNGVSLLASFGIFL